MSWSQSPKHKLVSVPKAQAGPSPPKDQLMSRCHQSSSSSSPTLHRVNSGDYVSWSQSPKHKLVSVPKAQAGPSPPKDQLMSRCHQSSSSSSPTLHRVNSGDYVSWSQSPKHKLVSVPKAQAGPSPPKDQLMSRCHQSSSSSSLLYIELIQVTM